MNKNICIILLFTFFFIGCTNTNLDEVSKEDLKEISEKLIVCEEPYIRNGVDCCLDENKNKICDSDEQTNNIIEEYDEVKLLSFGENELYEINIGGIIYNASAYELQDNLIGEFFVTDGLVTDLDIFEKVNLGRSGLYVMPVDTVVTDRTGYTDVLIGNYDFELTADLIENECYDSSTTTSKTGKILGLFEGDSTVYVKEDYCTEDILTYYDCSSDFIVEYETNCEFGCGSGACLNEEVDEEFDEVKLLSFGEDKLYEINIGGIIYNASAYELQDNLIGEFFVTGGFVTDLGIFEKKDLGRSGLYVMPVDTVVTDRTGYTDVLIGNYDFELTADLIENECYDSSITTSKAGKILGLFEGDSTVYVKEDYCTEDILTYYDCSSNFIVEYETSCNAGCESGACTEEEEEEEMFITCEVRSVDDINETMGNYYFYNNEVDSEEDCITEFDNTLEANTTTIRCGNSIVERQALFRSSENEDFEIIKVDECPVEEYDEVKLLSFGENELYEINIGGIIYNASVYELQDNLIGEFFVTGGFVTDLGIFEKEDLGRSGLYVMPVDTVVTDRAGYVDLLIGNYDFELTADLIENECYDSSTTTSKAGKILGLFEGDSTVYVKEDYCTEDILTYYDCSSNFIVEYETNCEFGCNGSQCLTE